MPRFDRYMLAQLMVVFGFFALVLISIYWVNQAVRLFDKLIADGQTALVFLEFTALSLPNVIRHVLPMAAFAASVYVGNRLASESELTVVQATGYSPMRLGRPVFVFGTIVAVMVLILTNWLVPASYRETNRRQAEIAQNVTARLLNEGTFLHPSDGVTFFVGDITRDGELRQVLLSDATAPDVRTTYTAKRALLVRSDTGPRLVMFNGEAQVLKVADRTLSVTRFKDFSYDISGLIANRPQRARSQREVSTLEALEASPAVLEETRSTYGQMMFEAHGRLMQGPQALIAAIVGFATLLVGGFSRSGLWPQIVGAIFVLIVLKTLDNFSSGLVRSGEAGWPMMYLGSVVGLAVAWLLFKLAERPALFARRARTA